MPLNTQEHTSRRYDEELETVRARVLQMGGLVETQITAAIEALTTGTLAKFVGKRSCQFCELIGDEFVDQFEHHRMLLEARHHLWRRIGASCRDIETQSPQQRETPTPISSYCYTFNAKRREYLLDILDQRLVEDHDQHARAV